VDVAALVVVAVLLVDVVVPEVLPVVVAVVEPEEPEVDRRLLSSLTVMLVSSLLVAPRKTFLSPRT
jgi:hypothetical protein